MALRRKKLSEKVWFMQDGAPPTAQTMQLRLWLRIFERYGYNLRVKSCVTSHLIAYL
jgi:hypothetical protein